MKIGTRFQVREGRVEGRMERNRSRVNVVEGARNPARCRLHVCSDDGGVLDVEEYSVRVWDVLLSSAADLHTQIAHAGGTLEPGTQVTRHQ